MARAAGAAPPARVDGNLLHMRPRFTGIGPLRFGMTPAEMRRASPERLYGDPPERDPQGCYYLAPQPDGSRVLLMVEGGRFVRVDVRTKAMVAPGGGRVDMTARRIQTLYAGRVSSAPGKYDPAAKVLTITSPGYPDARLVFETGKAGAVTNWRIGVLPQVAYVEGCG